MKILGFNITKAPDPGLAVGSQIRDNSPQGSVVSAFNNMVFRKIEPKFMEYLREAIPMCDTAINKLISMNGKIEIIGANAECVKELEDFCLSVPVGPVQHGIDAYRSAMWGEGFEQGFGYGELVATSDLKDIEGLRVADSKYIIYWKNADGIPEAWYLYPDKDTTRNTPLVDPEELIGKIINASYGQTLSYNQQDMVKLNPANKFYLAPRVENSNPYGIALFRSIPWVAQILVTLQNSMKNSSDRFGDPMYHAHASGKTTADKIKTLLDDLTAQLTSAITTKRQGGSADIITAGGENSKVEIKVLGHEGQIYPYEIPLKHVEESIVAASGLPAWVLGKYWSTTERMAQLEVEVVLADAAMRNTNETPGLIRLFSAVLAMRGKKWKTFTLDPNKPGDWGFRFISPNLHNEVQLAQAEFLRAQADMMRRGSAGSPVATVTNQLTEVPVGQAALPIPQGEGRGEGGSGGMVTIKSEGMDIQVPLLPAPPVVASPLAGEVGEGAASKADRKSVCSCGKSHSSIEATKELHRPAPWPELDAIEAGFEKDLKSDWQLLQKNIFDIVGLKIPDGQKDFKVFSEFTTVPSASSVVKAPFSFGDEERARIMASLDEYLGWNDAMDPDSTVRWSYMQSYSAGLIKAAELVGKERPLLDILKNSEIFNELVNSGFDLVKNNATKTIVDKIIPAMEQYVKDGANPRDAAAKLDALFWDKNADWERLTRTEMSHAAETAKLDEWEARDISVEHLRLDAQEATALGKNEGDTLVPVHPRCRCSITVKFVDNKWMAIFFPAPDACGLCLSLQEGSKTA